MAAKDELGRRGEDLAAEHLERQGLVVLSRNWRCRDGELDVVATDGLSTVVFCEVKSRSGEGFGGPLAAVTPAKRRRLRRLASLWLAAAGARWTVSRFDVIGVIFAEGRPPAIEHVVEAF